MNRRASLAFAALVALGSGALVASASGCGIQNEQEDLVSFPSKEQFVQPGGVSTFMEARCGAIDCHGQNGRPLRIYSKNGLRYEYGPNGTRDTRDTTDAERLENYRSVIGLEPGALGESVRTGGEYVDFQLLLKPLDIDGRGVRHKGGPVLRATPSDPGWTCLHGWIAGRFDARACQIATF